MLFVAGRDASLAKRLASADPTKIVKNINQTVVHQARKFVWGLDDGHLRFVQNRMSKANELPIISDQQKQQAIDAASGWGGEGSNSVRVTPPEPRGPQASPGVAVAPCTD